jgi:hypothetical protein
VEDSSETARVITEVSDLAGTLGVEIVDIAGRVDEVSEAAKRQEAAFGGLKQAADTVAGEQQPHRHRRVQRASGG